MNRPLYILHALGTVVLADDHACAGGKTHEKAHQHVDDGANTADGGVGFVAYEPTHHPGVHHVVKLLKNVACQQRKGEEYDMPGDITLGHIHILAALPEGILSNGHKDPS